MIVKKFKTVYVESYCMNKVFSGWCTSSCQGSTRISKARNQKAKERNVTYIKHFVPNGKTSAEYSLTTAKSLTSHDPKNTFQCSVIKIRSIASNQNPIIQDSLLITLAYNFAYINPLLSQSRQCLAKAQIKVKMLWFTIFAASWGNSYRPPPPIKFITHKTTVYFSFRVAIPTQHETQGLSRTFLAEVNDLLRKTVLKFLHTPNFKNINS